MQHLVVRAPSHFRQVRRTLRLRRLLPVLDALLATLEQLLLLLVHCSYLQMHMEYENIGYGG